MKQALIWGASGGIGRAVAIELVRREWDVRAVAAHPNDLEDVASQVVEADVTDAFAVQQAVLAVAQQVAGIDLMIYAVGDITARPVESLSPTDWRRVMGANLDGAFLVTHFSLPLLAADSHLVYIGAVHERMQLPGLASYAAAKAGLDAFTATLRKEQRGRRVTLVRPGAVDTPFWAKVPFRLPPQALSPGVLAERIVDFHEAGRQGVMEP